MDEIEMELNLVSIFAAIRQGNNNAAREIFESTLQEAVDNILDQVIKIILEKNGSCILVGEIEELTNNGNHWH